MVLAIFFLVVFQVLEKFKRPHFPPLPDTKRKYEDIKVVTENEYTAPSPGKYKIHIAWEILNIYFGAALTACSFWKVDAGLILYYRQYPESNAL